jgi:hypothetical protein
VINDILFRYIDMNYFFNVPTIYKIGGAFPKIRISFPDVLYYFCPLEGITLLKASYLSGQCQFVIVIIKIVVFF